MQVLQKLRGIRERCPAAIHLHSIAMGDSAVGRAFLQQLSSVGKGEFSEYEEACGLPDRVAKVVSAQSTHRARVEQLKAANAQVTRDTQPPRARARARESERARERAPTARASSSSRLPTLR